MNCWSSPVNVHNFREYDSLTNIIKSASSTLRSRNIFCQPRNVPHVRCFDVDENFLVLGWESGHISVTRRNQNEKSYSFLIKDDPPSLYSKNYVNVPLTISLRSSVNIIIVCSCICVPSPKKSKPSDPEKFDRLVTFVYRIPVSPNGSLSFKKMTSCVIRGLHHSLLSASPHVSSNADLVITGDSSGLIVASRFHHQVKKYSSVVLTAVPCTVLDLQVQSPLLLVTGRPFPQDRDQDADSAVEIVTSRDLIYFLFDTSSRNTIPLDFSEIIPTDLNLKVSCVRPAWLPKQNLANPLLFICSVDSNWTSTRVGVRLGHFPLIAVFTVHNLVVSLHRLIYLEECNNWNCTFEIPVLPSGISVDQHLDCPLLTTDSHVSDPSAGCENHLEPRLEKSLQLLSSNFLLLWSSPVPDKTAISPRLANSSMSKLMLVQLDPDHVLASVEPTFSQSYARLLAFSRRLGEIQSVVALWLKPCLGPISSIPARISTRLNGYVGMGCEIWVQRNVPDKFEREVPRLLLLSTRPLCAPKVAVAPSVDLSSLFTDQTRSNTPQQSSSSLNQYGPPTSNPTHFDPRSSSSNPRWLLPTDEYEVGVEVRGDLLNGRHSTQTDDFPVSNEATPSNGESQGSVCSEQLVQTPQVFQPLVNDQISEQRLSGEAVSSPATIQKSLGPSTMSSSLVQTVLNVALETEEIVRVTLGTASAAAPLQDLNSSTDQKCLGITDLSLNGPSGAPPSTDLFNSVTNDAKAQGMITNDVWNVYRCPSVFPSSDSFLTNLQLRSAFSTDGSELIPFVRFDGVPVVAILTPDTVRPSWVVAPKSFGTVYSFHVSPDGHLVWCLRDSSKLSSSSAVSGYTVDVCLERHGLRDLLSSWISGMSGSWELGVLLNVTSLDLHNTFALFTTASGLIKVQFGLSTRRPSCQSYTWPCPDYHALQVAASEIGLVWVLAVTKTVSGTSQDNPSIEELCLLSASLPVPSLSSPVNGAGHRTLRSSNWYPLQFPSLLQVSMQQVLRRTASLQSLTKTLNSSVHLFFSSQSNAILDAVPDQKQFCMGWLILWPFSTVDAVHAPPASGALCACGFFLPNLCPFYKVGDSHWFQAALNVYQNVSSPEPNLKNFFKRIGTSFSGPSSYNFLVRRISSYPLLIDSGVSPPDRYSSDSLIQCGLPIWITIQRPDACTTLIARIHYTLSVYQWSRDPIQLHNIRSRSLLPSDAVLCHVWKFPLLIFATHVNDSTGCDGEDSLWIVDAITNELFYHSGSSHCRSLALPTHSSEREEITAFCACADSQSGFSRLLVATQTGHLWSRSGITVQCPVGSSWVAEAFPPLWLQNFTSECKSKSACSNYIISLACVNRELWATDSSGSLFHADIGGVSSAPANIVRIINQWSIVESPVPHTTASESNLFFISVAAADWSSVGLGVTVWAIARSATRSPSSEDRVDRSDSKCGFVYTRCWNPERETFSWLHVPSPLSCRIAVTSQQSVCILTAHYPHQLYIRQGLSTLHTLLEQPVLPAPLEQTIGYSWQLIPHPEPLFHTLSLSDLMLFGDHCTSRSGTKSFAKIVCETGELLRLSYGPSLAFCTRTRNSASGDSISSPDDSDLIVATTS